MSGMNYSVSECGLLYSVVKIHQGSYGSWKVVKIHGIYFPAVKSPGIRLGREKRWIIMWKVMENIWLWHEIPMCFVCDINS